MVTTYTNDCERSKGLTTNNYAVTDWTEDHAMDCNTDNVASVANVLGTLMLDLIRQGIIKGTVATT